MEPSTQSPERAPIPEQSEAVQYEPRPLEYGQRSLEQTERLGGLVSSAERLPPAVERQSPPPVPATTALPAPQSDATTTTNSGSVAGDDVPLVAADEDVIEKEWVDKVKRVLLETKDDPYKREQEVKRLQIEYVRRRYGREIGDPGE